MKVVHTSQLRGRLRLRGGFFHSTFSEAKNGKIFVRRCRRCFLKYSTGLIRRTASLCWTKLPLLVADSCCRGKEADAHRLSRTSHPRAGLLLFNSCDTTASLAGADEDGPCSADPGQPLYSTPTALQNMHGEKRSRKRQPACRALCPRQSAS